MIPHTQDTMILSDTMIPQFMGSMKFQQGGCVGRGTIWSPYLVTLRQSALYAMCRHKHYYVIFTASYQQVVAQLQGAWLMVLCLWFDPSHGQLFSTPIHLSQLTGQACQYWTFVSTFQLGNHNKQSQQISADSAIIYIYIYLTRKFTKKSLKTDYIRQSLLLICIKISYQNVPLIFIQPFRSNIKNNQLHKSILFTNLHLILNLTYILTFLVKKLNL